MSKLKLTIELVPATSWGNNIRAIMTNRQWNALRGMVCDRTYGTCEICEEKGFEYSAECHEIWHYNEKTQIQKLIGLLCLCPNCHLVKHFGLAQVKGKRKEALNHFMKVNDIGKDEAESYIKEVFQIYNNRTQYFWKLDLSYLKRYGIDPAKLKEPE